MKIIPTHYIGLLLFMGTCLVAVDNELQKVFYHRSGIADIARKGKQSQKKNKTNHERESELASHHQLLDLGKVVFYFQAEPFINRLPSSQESSEQSVVEFIVPSALIKTSEAKKMVHKLNTTGGPLFEGSPLYKVMVEQVTRPTNGLKITITYDKRRVSYDIKAFDSIGKQKGLVIDFYNQALLTEIKQRGTSILTVGSNTRKRRIVVDCGHGGEDAGAAGFFNVKEKDICLAVGLELARQLEERGYTVLLTRTEDVFVPLDERTTHANAWNADLFVSLHANHAQNSAVSGLETWCLTKELFKEVISGADTQWCALANMCSAKRYNESSMLAHCIHTSTITQGKKEYQQLTDRKIRNSVAQVLLGTTMPAALVELGYLSHKQDSTMLVCKKYQRLLAQGICRGIELYLHV